MKLTASSYAMINLKYSIGFTIAFTKIKHVLLFAIFVKVSLLVVRIDVRCLDLVKDESSSPKSGHHTAIYQPLLIWEPLKQKDIVI